MQHANELINIFKVVNKIEKEIRSAQDRYKNIKRQELELTSGQRYLFLKRLYNEVDNVRIDKDLKK